MRRPLLVPSLLFLFVESVLLGIQFYVYAYAFRALDATFDNDALILFRIQFEFIVPIGAAGFFLITAGVGMVRIIHNRDRLHALAPGWSASMVHDIGRWPRGMAASLALSWLIFFVVGVVTALVHVQFASLSEMSPVLFLLNGVALYYAVMATFLYSLRFALRLPRG